MINLGLEGKSALVTGASKGIGSAIALQLAEQGVRIAVNYNRSEEDAKAVVETALKMGGEAFIVRADVSDPDQVNAMVDKVHEAWGHVDILVNNAGIINDGLVVRMSDEAWESVISTNLNGTFYCARAVLRNMVRQRRGRIINIGSVVGERGNVGQTNYSAAKGAIASMTYTMSIELARYGIRVNAISPSGSTRMSATSRVGGQDVEIPFIDPGLNAPVVVFLISDEADYVTGQVIGTGGERLFLMSQPKYYYGLLRSGGWSVEDVRARFKDAIGNRLEPVGIMKAPYPFYGGIKPPSKE